MSDVSSPDSSGQELLDAHNAPQAECECLKLCVTAQDRYWSERSDSKNPFLCALQRTTSTLWRIYEDGFALETTYPFRACQLPCDAVRQWHHWRHGGEMEGGEWEVELVPTHESDGFAEIQQRQLHHLEKSLRDKVRQQDSKGRMDWVG